MPAILVGGDGHLMPRPSRLLGGGSVTSWMGTKGIDGSDYVSMSLVTNVDYDSTFSSDGYMQRSGLACGTPGGFELLGSTRPLFNCTDYSVVEIGSTAGWHAVWAAGDNANDQGLQGRSEGDIQQQWVCSATTTRVFLQTTYNGSEYLSQCSARAS